MLKVKLLVLCFLALILTAHEILPQTGDFRFSTLTFSDLRSLHLLEATKDPIASKEGYWRKVSGVRVDSEKENIHFGVISGAENLSGEAHDPMIAVDKGYIRVFQIESGKFKSTYWKEFDYDHGIACGIQAHIIKPGIPIVLVCFGVPGSTFFATYNEIVIPNGDMVRVIEKESPDGPIRIKDIDNDGLDEIIVQEIAPTKLPSTMRIHWLNVCEISDNSLKTANEKYPDYYKKVIIPYYEGAIADAHGTSDQAYYVEQYISEVRTLIEKAKALAKIR